MRVYLNGDYLEESAARVPVTDRGFLLGDAIFETLRSAGGEPLLWEEHAARFRRGAELLAIPVPLDAGGLRAVVTELLRVNRLSEAVVRITLTRGSGPRGYSPRGADRPCLLITTQPAPEPFGGGVEGWDVVTSRWPMPLPGLLSEIKHANRLTSILARSEADAAGAHEAFLLSAAGEVAEASGSNVAWMTGGTMVMPGLETGALPGVMQEFVRRIADRLGWPSRYGSMAPEGLRDVDGVFLTNSVQLLVPVRSVDRRVVRSCREIAVLAGELRRILLRGGF